ncbi:PAS domain-containing protein [Haloarcula laminariae]|uniref:PAS domain-containing protein n=1 Tax=Haloarcula laminariae TaxID=2961577 RepID=UPI0024060EE9|nr:PAS domain-containing sensor histidine kinase [Halomicroarcula sp. FL173]
MTIEQILYVGTNVDYVTAIENEAPDTVTVKTTETAENVDSFPRDAPDSVAIVDTTSIDRPVHVVQSLADHLETAPVVAVIASTTDPLVVFDVLMAGATDYVERGAPSGRPTQLLAHLEATSENPASVADGDDAEQRFRQELKARRRTEQRLTTVLDRIPQPVFYRDADGIYLGCNAAFESLCGQPREEIVGYKTEHLQNQELADICEQHDETVLKTGEKQTMETTVTLQGEQRHIRVHKAPLTAEQTGVEGVVGSIEDVTEQRRQEQTLREQTGNLEILNRVTRHDIRNDLQVVLGMAEVLRDHVDEDGKEYLDTMVTKGHHAVDITRQARDLTETMLDSEFGTDRIPLESTLETQIDEIRSTYSQAIITVEGEIPSTAVVADGMLASVFRNILANGIQHNDSAVPQLRVWVQTTGDRVTVHIADNGPGVPDDRKDEIFGRGEKGLESSGTGLGLYLVDTLVDRYGGDVYVTDSDEGAEFVISLRRAE